jgi:hypothetical protein
MSIVVSVPLASSTVDRLRHQLADGSVVVRRHGGHLLLLAMALHRPRQRPERLDRRFGAAIDAPLQVDGAGAGGDVAHAFGQDGVRQNGRGRGAVADGVAGALGGPAQQLRPEVLVGILQRELLGDGDAVVAHERHAPLLLDQHRLGPGAERHTHGVGNGGGASEHPLARIRPEPNLFVSHALYQSKADARIGHFEPV